MTQKTSKYNRRSTNNYRTSIRPASKFRSTVGRFQCRLVFTHPDGIEHGRIMNFLSYDALTAGPRSVSPFSQYSRFLAALFITVRLVNFPYYVQTGFRSRGIPRTRVVKRRSILHVSTIRRFSLTRKNRVSL